MIKQFQRFIEFLLYRENKRIFCFHRWNILIVLESFVINAVLNALTRILFRRREFFYTKSQSSNDEQWNILEIEHLWKSFCFPLVLSVLSYTPCLGATFKWNSFSKWACFYLKSIVRNEDRKQCFDACFVRMKFWPFTQLSLLVFQFIFDQSDSSVTILVTNSWFVFRCFSSDHFPSNVIFCFVSLNWKMSL